MLAHEIKGEGKPLVLLHAFPLSSKMWKDEIGYLSSSYKVIAPDFPGFGRSPVKEKVSLNSAVQDIAALLGHLQIRQPVFLAGLSMGGYTAFEFFRQFPKRVGALGLFATKAAPDTPQGREKRMLSIQALEKFGMDPFARKIVKSQLGKTTQEKNPELTARVIGIMKDSAPAGAIAALRAMADRRDSSDLLKTISVPTLVMAGQEDEIVPAAEMQAMSDQISGAEFHAVPGSGHLINLEQPKAFREIFEKFLYKTAF